MSSLKVKLSFPRAYTFFWITHQHFNTGRFLQKNLDFSRSFEMLEDLAMRRLHLYSGTISHWGWLWLPLQLPRPSSPALLRLCRVCFVTRIQSRHSQGGEIGSGMVGKGGKAVASTMLWSPKGPQYINRTDVQYICGVNISQQKKGN